MFGRHRKLIGLFLPLVLAGSTVFSSEAFGQKAREVFVYGPPSLSLAADQAVISACEGDGAPTLVRLNATASSPNGNPIRYRWTSSAGRLEGEGPAITWDLAGLKPGYYKAFLAIATGSGDESCEAFSSTAVLVKCQPPLPAPVCPTVSISCPDRIGVDQPVTFTSAVTGSLGNIAPTYNWTVSAGRIIEGQGTPSIKVDTVGLAGQTVQASLSLGGYTLDCSAHCSIEFPVPITCRKFDEFGEIARNDEKARLDNFAIELQRDPASRGYVIVYPGQQGRPSGVQLHSSRIVDYLVNSRGFDASRIITVIGPMRGEKMVELWSCPQNAKPPTPAP